MKTSIRVLLADDHKVLREGLRSLLEAEPGLLVVAEAETGEQAIQLTDSAKPDVVVMDLGLRGMNGLEAIRQIRDRWPQISIVVLSMYASREFVRKALKAGCDGYVPKSATHTDLVRAIQVVCGGERYLHPKAATALVEDYLGTDQEAGRLSLLSARETEVLQLAAMGYTGREIAERLSLSPKTVETYRQRAMSKLGLASRSELVRFALQAGLLDEASFS